eukprot:5735757-Amphidinium_carterae.1
MRRPPIKVSPLPPLREEASKSDINKAVRIACGQAGNHVQHSKTLRQDDKNDSSRVASSTR